MFVCMWVPKDPATAGTFFYRETSSSSMEVFMSSSREGTSDPEEIKMWNSYLSHRISRI